MVGDKVSKEFPKTKTKLKSKVKEIPVYREYEKSQAFPNIERIQPVQERAFIYQNKPPSLQVRAYNTQYPQCYPTQYMPPSYYPFAYFNNPNSYQQYQTPTLYMPSYPTIYPNSIQAGLQSPMRQKESLKDKILNIFQRNQRRYDLRRRRYMLRY